MLDVRYERFPPPPGTSSCVEHLWMVEAPAGTRTKREILIPNGRPAAVWCLGEPGVLHDPLTGTSQPHRGVVFGITTRPLVLEQQGASSYAGAQLTPWGLAALLPGEPLVDTFRPAAQWLGPESGVLAAELAAARFGPERAAVLGSFLSSRIVPADPDAVDRLSSAVTAVEAAAGRLGVPQLATDLGMSHSSFYRLCKRYLGVGPKEFCEITRYYHFVGGLLAESRGDTAALLAGLHGYYDQAHASRSFKRFTGVTPSTFKKINNGIARLMHS